MSLLSKRRARIVRIRSIEHRVAAARQAAAERRVADLLGVARRLGDLRAGLYPAPGPADGQSLQAMAEMQTRLAHAARDLLKPIRQAEAHHEQASAVRLIARTREDGAERLRDKAAAGEESAAMLRENAGRRVVKRRRA